MKNVLLSCLIWAGVVGCSKPVEPPAQVVESAGPSVTATLEPSAPVPVAAKPELERAPVPAVPLSPPPPLPVPAPAPAPPKVAAPVVPVPSAAAGVPQTYGSEAAIEQIRSLAGGLTQSAAATPDRFLQEISVDVGRTIQALSGSAAGDPGLQGILQESLQSLVDGRDAEAMAGYSKVMDVRFSSQQEGYATAAANAIEAFVVQRNFSGLSGAGPEVSLLVNALRYGDVNTTLKAAQALAAVGGLTPSQQGILTAIQNRTSKVQAN